MAGYVHKKKLYKLKFKDPDMNGLVVKATSLTMGAIVEADELDPDERGKRLLELFGAALVEWNLEEEDGTPVPATYEGVLKQEGDFINTLVSAWQEAVMGVSVPLEQTSSDGNPSLEASLPMESL